jgi:hypothetical protein
MRHRLKEVINPFTKGSSGPTTTMVTFLNNKCFYSFKIGYAHGTLVIAAVPAFPGATKEYHSGL